LPQEIISGNGKYFLNQSTRYTHKLNILIHSTILFTSQDIENELELKNRFKYNNFFKSYNIPWLTDQKDEDLIEYIYTKRNHLVHNVNRQDTKTTQKLSRMSIPIQEENILTEIKRISTKIGKMIHKLDHEVKVIVYK
jgi:hypothetical protein